jgi:hypothetical protein
MVFHSHLVQKRRHFMKTKFPALVLALALFGAPAFAGVVRLTGNLSADIRGNSSDGQSVNTFTVAGQPLFWGFGGDYGVSFFRDAGTQWWMDWCAPALFLSYHPLGAKSFLDPFFQVGVGSAGRVMLARRPLRAPDGLELSLFPFVAAGLAVNLDGLLLAAKAAYTPVTTPIPATDIPGRPLGTLQVTLSAGVSFGW